MALINPTPDSIVMDTLEKSRDMIFKIVKRAPSLHKFGSKPDAISRTDSITSLLYEEIESDYRKSTEPRVSRREPVYGGQAMNMHPETFSGAKILGIDASTRPPHEQKWPFVIQGASFRPFIPYQGERNDENHLRNIKGHIYSYILNDNDTLAKQIASTVLDGSGMYLPAYPKAFYSFAPRICLTFANMNKHEDRTVFMLRPSNGRVNRWIYKAYCYIVMTSFMKRCGASCDLGFWDNQEDDFKRAFSESMLVLDSQLMTRNNRSDFAGYPDLISVPKEAIEIKSACLLEV